MTDAKLAPADAQRASSTAAPPDIVPEWLQRLAERSKPPISATAVLVGIGRNMLSKLGVEFAFGFDGAADTLAGVTLPPSSPGIDKACQIVNSYYRQHAAQHAEFVQRMLQRLRRELSDADVEQLYDEMDTDVQEAIVHQVQKTMSSAELERACDVLDGSR